MRVQTSKNQKTRLDMQTLKASPHMQAGKVRVQTNKNNKKSLEMDMQTLKAGLHMQAGKVRV